MTISMDFYHGTQWEVFVVLLQFFRRAVTVTDIKIIEKKFFSWLEHPIKHLQIFFKNKHQPDEFWSSSTDLIKLNQIESLN